MSLLVDISVVADSIVKAAWARAVANRERLRRRLDVQSAREAAITDRTINAINGKLILGSSTWEQLYTTPTPLRYKPDEPAAYPSRQAEAGNLVTAGAFWIGGSQTSTGFFAPYQTTGALVVRSGDFTASITEDLGYTGAISIPGVGDFGFRNVFTAFPLAGSGSAIVMYAKVPTADLALADAGDYAVFESLSGGAPPPPGGFDPDDFALKQFWFLVTRTTVERIADLTYPLYERAYYQTEDDILPPFDPEPNEYLTREFNTAANPLEGVSQEINDAFSGILTPVSYGVRRLFNGDPYSTVAAFPGHASLNTQPLADRIRIAYPITLAPEEFEGFNLYACWDANQPGLCTSELAAMGYPPPP
jgi:hypothetical protein